jgi:quercetin dioxygenase-like cupin family protein
MESKSLSLAQEYSETQFTKRIIHKKGESVVFALNFMPGQELPPHKHPNTDVYILVLEGNGTITVDGQQAEVKKDDVIHCDGNEQFSYKNSGEVQSSLYVVLSKVPDERFAQNV